MRKTIALAALALAAGCATTGGASPPLPVPPEMQVHLRHAQEVGMALYEHDQAAAIGTDVLRAKLGSLEGRPLAGYVTLREAGDQGGSPVWLVHFFTKESPPRIAYTIRIASSPGTKPAFEALDPPVAPAKDVLAQIRARQTAVAELKRREPPRQPINPVVLPGALLGEAGHLVYLLAGTTRPGVVVIGKHHRVLVSEDGASVLRFEPMSKSILELEPPPGVKAADALFVTHLLTEWPLETHVFASLLHRRALYVVTEKWLWRIGGEQIAMFKNE